jgi:NAD(P)H-hydrate epimerase
MKVVTVEEMRAMEQRAIDAGVSEDTLMEAAGLAVARRIAQITDGVRGRRILVLVGPGNNGGDGMVAARYLTDWGALVTLYLVTRGRREDKLEACEASRVRVVEGADDAGQWALGSYLPITDIVVDAVLGIGSRRPLDGTAKRTLDVVAAAKRDQPGMRVVSVDVPSGIDANIGHADESTPFADLTLALGAPKAGLYRFPAAAHTGAVEVLGIGLPDGVDSDLRLDLAEDATVARLLPRRAADGHKGTFGTTLIVGGSRNFVGATVLAASGAYRAGAGLVTLAAPDAVYRLAAAQLPEATYVPLAETSGGFVAPQAVEDVLRAMASASSAVIGPGLGGAESVQRFVQSLLLNGEPVACPLVIDADGLNALAKTYGWQDLLSAQAVLTPHPGEMGRLLRASVGEVQADRVAIAQQAARDWGQVIVLKGPYTVVTAPDGPTSISPFANAALASGGTGDVLSGIIAALLAQGLTPYSAAVAGVHLHGLAAERFRAASGDAGLMASDLLAHVPTVMRDLRAIGFRPTT